MIFILTASSLILTYDVGQKIFASNLSWEFIILKRLEKNNHKICRITLNYKVRKKTDSNRMVIPCNCYKK